MRWKRRKKDGVLKMKGKIYGDDTCVMTWTYEALHEAQVSFTSGVFGNSDGCVWYFFSGTNFENFETYIKGFCKKNLRR